MLCLRPHHLLDIIRNIGHSRPLVPHPYGHAQHIVSRNIMDGSEKLIKLTVGADDLCKPCIHLTREGQCDDLLSQPDIPVSKQAYNDELDRRLLTFFGLQEGTLVSLSDILRLIRNNFDELVPLCIHPGEDFAYRQEGLRKGVEILIVSIFHNHLTE